MKRLLALAVITFSLIMFNSCSTIMHSTTQVIEFNSNPPNAKIIVDGQKFGTSPQFVNIERGRNHIIKFELDGFETYETQLTRKISFWFWVNAFNAFVPGMIIDMFTGSMYNILPEKIDVELSPAKIEIQKKKR